MIPVALKSFKHAKNLAPGLQNIANFRNVFKPNFSSKFMPGEQVANPPLMLWLDSLNTQTGPRNSFNLPDGHSTSRRPAAIVWVVGTLAPRLVSPATLFCFGGIYRFIERRLEGVAIMTCLLFK
jgi:hypothetical protein